MEEKGFKEGDWVVITKGDRNWCSGEQNMDRFVDMVVQVTTTSSRDTPNDVIRFKEDTHNWQWVFGDGHFRRALPEEIPGYKAPEAVINTYSIY